ncbi:MAG TPA: M48 family metalloprotease [Kofleriaceae bacterium]|nr:M48 family metalloprotease [Kofleriaceae bacterium]
MNQLKTIALLGVLSAILIVIGRAVSPGAMWIFGGLAVAMNLAAYFFSDRVVLAMSRARPLRPGQDPELERIVTELAGAAEIPVPRIYMIDDDAPNAFATGRNPEHGVVAVTTGIRRLLGARELRGVIAHELSHIRNRDILVASVAAMIASVIAMLASLLRWGALFGGVGRDDREGGGAGGAIAAIGLAIVAPIAATIIQLAVSRQREYGADATGAALSGDPLALASALAKLHRGNQAIPMQTVGDNPATASLFIVAPLSGAEVASWFSTHPPIAERIRRLQDLAAAGHARAA